MVIMQTLTFPLEKLVDVAKTFARVESESPLPPYVKRTGPYGANAGEHKVVVILEVEKGQEDEAIKEQTKRLIPFYSIEGLKITWEIMLPSREIMSMLPL